MNYDLSMNANQLVAFLQKQTSEFTKADIISFIQQKISAWLILCIRRETGV